MKIIKSRLKEVAKFITISSKGFLHYLIKQKQIAINIKTVILLRQF